MRTTTRCCVVALLLCCIVGPGQLFPFPIGCVSAAEQLCCAPPPPPPPPPSLLPLSPLSPCCAPLRCVNFNHQPEGPSRCLGTWAAHQAFLCLAAAAACLRLLCMHIVDGSTVVTLHTECSAGNPPGTLTIAGAAQIFPEVHSLRIKTAIVVNLTLATQTRREKALQEKADRTSSRSCFGGISHVCTNLGSLYASDPGKPQSTLATLSDEEC